MLNLIPNTVNSLVVYADTVSGDRNAGNYFLLVLTNSYSRQTFAVVPNVVRRNARFVEFEIELVASAAQNDELNGQIYLYDHGNWEYLVFNTSEPTLTPEGDLACKVWNTDTDFWNFSETVWNLCDVIAKEIDRGQAFLFSPVPEEREIDFTMYVSPNDDFQSVVYVSGSTGNTGPSQDIFPIIKTQTINKF
jgi:hypothetical protein